MDWFRRNWPDLVIGVALVAVVALIVVTLLSGGSLASLVRRDAPADLITDTTGPDAAETASSDTNPDTAAQAAPDGAAGGIDVFVPGVPSGSAGTEAGTQAGSAEQADSSTQPAAANDAATPAGSDALPQAAAAGGFRVAAGAVDSRPAAVSLAEQYRENSLPVTVEQQDNLYLLWVGPYATRPQADRVAARIIADGGDALVYTYDGGDDTATPETASAPEPETAASASQPEAAIGTVADDVPDNAPETATETGPADTAVASAPDTNPVAGVATNAAATPPTPDAVADAVADTPASAGDGATAVGQRYLQVGAFVSDESAAPLRSQLETLGLSVSRTEDETGLVRLFVGPFEDARLAQTQSRLSAEGIVGSFPVTR